MPISPGITVCPVRSITFAPAGGAICDDAPTAWILPWLIIIVRSSCTAPPVPSMTLTCVRATTGESTATKGWTPGNIRLADWPKSRLAASKKITAVRWLGMVASTQQCNNSHEMAARNDSTFCAGLPISLGASNSFTAFCVRRSSIEKTQIIYRKPARGRRAVLWRCANFICGSCCFVAPLDSRWKD